jgi:uncharacterized protein involved in exopolysaccharide biosynthesis
MSTTMRPPLGTVPPPGYLPGPAPAAPDPRERIARFKTITRRAFGYWKTAFLLLVIGTAISLFVAIRTKRVYRSEAVVLFRPAMALRDDMPPAEKAMRLGLKLKDTLVTRGRLERIVREQNLYPEIVDTRGMIDAVEEMRKHVGFRSRDSETFVISFQGHDQDLVQHVTQHLADTMIEEFSQSNVSASQQQAKFLEGESKQAEQDLERATAAAATFLALHPEFARDPQLLQVGMGAASQLQVTPLLGGGQIVTGTTSPTPVPQTSDAQLGALYRQRAKILDEAKAASAPRPDPNAAVQAARLEELVRQRDEAARTVAQAQADVTMKRAQYTDQHPDMIAARAAADSASRALQAAEARVKEARSAMPSSSAPPATMSAELKARLDQVESQIAARQSELRRAQIPAAKDAGGAAAQAAGAATSTEPKTPESVLLETEWQRLIRAVGAARTRHFDLRDRLEKAQLQASAVAGTIGDHMEIIDPAYRPTKPSKGGRSSTAMLGFGVTVFICLLYAYARVVFNDTLIDVGDVKAIGVIPVLGVIPRLPPSPSGAPNDPSQKKKASGVV